MKIRILRLVLSLLFVGCFYGIIWYLYNITYISEKQYTELMLAVSLGLVIAIIIRMYQELIQGKKG